MGRPLRTAETVDGTAKSGVIGAQSAAGQQIQMIGFVTGGLGDTILVRNDFTVNPNTNNSSLQFRYELGTGAGAYTLDKRLGRLDEGSGSDYRFSLNPDLIYMGDTNTRDNPITLQVKLSTGGTLINAGSVIQVIRYKDS